jgi:hypothetical protein
MSATGETIKARSQQRTRCVLGSGRREGVLSKDKCTKVEGLKIKESFNKESEQLLYKQYQYSPEAMPVASICEMHPDQCICWIGAFSRGSYLTVLMFNPCQPDNDFPVMAFSQPLRGRDSGWIWVPEAMQGHRCCSGALVVRV